MGEKALGLRLEMELDRRFEKENIAEDAWMRLRTEAARVEGIETWCYDGHGIRAEHPNDAHEVVEEEGQWKVRSRWYVVCSPRRWPGGAAEAKGHGEKLKRQLERRGRGVGLDELKLTVHVVPAEDWK